jgi:hypothetical protein
MAARRSTEFGYSSTVVDRPAADDKERKAL